MQSTQWTIHDLSRTDHNKHSACKYKRYGEKFNASIQTMVKRLTSKTVVLSYHHSIQHMVSLHTTFITRCIVKRLHLSILHLDHHQACIKTMSKREKNAHYVTHYILTSKNNTRCTNIKEYIKNTQPKKKTSVYT